MNDNNEDTYKIFHGLKPVKRNRRKEGQSEYYYLDPRGTDRFADFKEIDVESEDSPNPKIKAILRDDLKKNERDYYIWRTRKDEKVRGKHAEREGKIFNWHIPPTGGHPGEDYNCRCWAEPYREEMAEQFNITPKFDLSGLPQYAENDKAEIKSDATYVSTDEFLYARMWENIKEQEDVILYPYLDTKGFITIGAGANVDDWNVFKKLNLTVNGLPATEAQKWEAYKHMRELSEEKDENGNYVNRNRFAETFESETNIRISDTEAHSLAQNHMNNDLAHLRKEFTDFDSFPLPLKEVLLDIQYNVIGGVNQHDWPKLYKAIREKNVFGKEGIVANVNRKDVSIKRNNWAKNTARSIKF